LLSINPDVILESYVLPIRFTCSASDDIVFEKLTGIPELDLDLYISYEGVNNYRIEVRIPGTVKVVSL
jgi:hypothetical protein